jgi:hypothetical protein
MKIYFRISDNGYNKIKPSYVTSFNCFNNYCNSFKNKLTDTFLIADTVKDETWESCNEFKERYKLKDVIRTQEGSSAAGFRYCYNHALENFKDDEEIIYFIEGDFIHKPNSDEILESAFDMGAHYVSLYDHPDKYLPSYQNGETTKVYLGKYCHWKLTISTVMTFASKIKTLKEDRELIWPFISETYPQDHNMFIELRKKGRTLITPLPGYSTHGEIQWLSKYTDWEAVMAGEDI